MTYKEVILGCAPFVGGMQFGHRSRIYELDFKNQPENIVEIINKAQDMNVTQIILKSNNDLVNAIKLSENDGFHWNKIGVTDCDNFEEDMNTFINLSASTILLSHDFVDKQIKDNNLDLIKKYLDIIVDNGFISGIESLEAFHNTPILYNSDIKDSFEVYMVPVNYYGYMLDCNYFEKKNKDIYKENLIKMDKKIIANHTLATGILKPMEAYEFMKNIDYIDSVCVGVAKKEEAEETFGVINSYI